MNGEGRRKEGKEVGDKRGRERERKKTPESMSRSLQVFYYNKKIRIKTFGDGGQKCLFNLDTLCSRQVYYLA